MDSFVTLGLNLIVIIRPKRFAWLQLVARNVGCYSASFLSCLNQTPPRSSATCDLRLSSLLLIYLGRYRLAT